MGPPLGPAPRELKLPPGAVEGVDRPRFPARDLTPYVDVIRADRGSMVAFQSRLSRALSGSPESPPLSQRSATGGYGELYSKATRIREDAAPVSVWSMERKSPSLKVTLFAVSVQVVAVPEIVQVNPVLTPFSRIVIVTI